MGLSYTLIDAIQMVELLKETNKIGFSIQYKVPKMRCKVLEENLGGVEMVTTQNTILKLSI